MKFILLFILFSVYFGHSHSYGKEDDEITKIEIFARLVDEGRHSGLPIDKKGITKKHTIYVSLNDGARIRLSNIDDLIDDLELANEQYQFEDYIALAIVHYSNKKKEKYYIAGGNAGIYKNNLRYEYSCSFVSTIYSFLPVYYYEYGEPFYYRKPCDSDVSD